MATPVKEQAWYKARLARNKTNNQWSSLVKGRLNPHYKEKKRKFGWLAEQQIIINSDEISRRDS